jgi:hypothetical protein
VSSLKQHVATGEDEYRRIDEMMGIPLSDVIADEEVRDCIDLSKGQLKHVDQDLRDARRRINGAKGPRPKAKAKAADAVSDSDGEGSEAA